MLCRHIVFQYLNRSRIIRGVSGTLKTRTKLMVVKIHKCDDVVEYLGLDSTKTV